MSDEELDRSRAEVSVYARVNPEHKLRIVKALQRRGRVGGDDGRWCQRCAGLEDRRHRRRDGDHRHGCVQRGSRHRPGGRQLRIDRRRSGRGPGDFLQHPQIPALSAVLEHRRSDDDVPRRGVRRCDRTFSRRVGRGSPAIARDADPLGQSRLRWRAGAGARRRSAGCGSHGQEATSSW